ncbi:MAG: ABC transporter ATP-binding protein [Clostridiales bacterium]|nr:ABC transporter ATP-binding protein [Clostridiales bacterium]
MVRRFISYYKPHKVLFTLDLIAAFFVSVCDLVYPVITRNMLNSYIPDRNMTFLIIGAGALVLAYIIKMGLNYFISYNGHLVGVYMQADMRRELFSHLQKLPFSYYDEHETGGIISRIVNDLMDISELAHHGPEDLFISGIMLIGAFIYLSTINIVLTLIIFAFIPILIFFSWRMRKRMMDAFMETRKKVAVINSTIENSITGIRVAKAFTNSEYEEKKFEEGNVGFVSARSRAYKAMAQFFSGTGFIISLLNVAVLVGGGIFTYNGVIDYVDLTTFMLFINLFTTPIRTLVNFMEQFQNGMTGFKRYIEIIDEPIENEKEGAAPLNNVRGEIEFNGVSFSYNNGLPVLEDVSLKVEAGTTLALVGPSGGGKTTICHLIPAFYPLERGSITIDGVAVEDITFESLRQNIGIVQQDVFLFNSTIRDNIAYGKMDATDEEIFEAVRMANLTEFIASLENGLDTQVGERGVRLSGGQKQRIGIARVFLKNPKILILDEATSALDNATELMIQQSLSELCKGRTCIVVAHRLSTVKNANEIAVIEGGRLVEKGTHEELLEKKGSYEKLYTAQFTLVNG